MGERSGTPLPTQGSQAGWPLRVAGRDPPQTIPRHPGQMAGAPRAERGRQEEGWRDGRALCPQGMTSMQFPPTGCAPPQPPTPLLATVIRDFVVTAACVSGLVCPHSPPPSCSRQAPSCGPRCSLDWSGPWVGGSAAGLRVVWVSRRGWAAPRGSRWGPSTLPGPGLGGSDSSALLPQHPARLWAAAARAASRWGELRDLGCRPHSLQGMRPRRLTTPLPSTQPCPLAAHSRQAPRPALAWLHKQVQLRRPPPPPQAGNATFPK